MLPEEREVAGKKATLMRVAIVHERLDVVGGAERVVLALHRIYPQAPVYTSFVDREGLARDGDLHPEFQRMEIRTSFMQRLPRWMKRRSDRLLPLYMFAFQGFDLSEYDVVISSSYVAAKSVLTSAETCHICFCHTPMRYAWEMFPQYIGSMRNPFTRGAAHLFLQYFRIWDLQTAYNVNYFISTSDVVRRRIRKHYGRDSYVIHPPVETHRFRVSSAPKDYYVAISRLVPYKRIDLAVEAFNRLGRKLVVIGDGRDFARIRAQAGPNIAVLGWQPDAVVAQYLSEARALIFPGEEDFGILPVEAQAAGTPVIAFGRGGALETVVHGRTGLFFPEQKAEALMEAVRQFECLTWDRQAIAEHARQFDEAVFQRKIQQYVEQCYREFRADRRVLPPLAQDSPAFALEADDLAIAAAHVEQSRIG